MYAIFAFMENPNSYPYALPIGQLLVIGDSQGIHAIVFSDKNEETISNEIPGNPTLDSWPVPVRQCFQQLDEYFAGKRTEFEVKLSPEATEFQQKVWDELLKIPLGKTVTYGMLY